MIADLTPRPIELAAEARFRLGDLEVRPSTVELIGPGGRETLEPRIMQVLVALSRRRGEVVSRDELIQLCWAGRVVGDDAINRCIARLRRLFEAQGGFQIETQARVGYRLRSATERPDEPRSAAGMASVLVLPFLNMSGDSEQEFFSDGISEDIITDLSKVSSLFVVGRPAAFALKGEAIQPQEVAHRLNVGHVLTGSVRKADGRVRISTQLIRGGTGEQIWAERYDRELSHIFELQDDISQAIVAALRVRLLPAEKSAMLRRETADVEAYELLLMARQEYVNGDQGDPAWTQRIIRLCERATEIDPQYASAWAYLALGHVAAQYLHAAPSARGLSAAERALALNPDLADAHAVRARYFSDKGILREHSRKSASPCVWSQSHGSRTTRPP